MQESIAKYSDTFKSFCDQRLKKGEALNNPEAGTFTAIVEPQILCFISMFDQSSQPFHVKDLRKPRDAETAWSSTFFRSIP